MTFDEALSQVKDLLQREQRVSYRGLKRRFDLDDEYLEDLKEELIGAKRLAVDEDGRFLVWAGDSGPESRVQSLESKGQEQDSTVQTSDPRRQTLDAAAERRQLTVMFCDLVGSTTLSAQLDPEEFREVVRTYQLTSATVIERFGGHIAQYLGDGLLVYFGYPTAHEDDAARAVRAGLEIVGAIRGQVTGEEGQAKRQPLQVRIGIHTGLVVVGEMGGGSRHEQLALGETPNIAARIQGQANPDEVVISAATHRLVEGLFDCEDRGQPELKGVMTPLTLYRVVKEGEAQSRFQVVVRKGLTPLVGRDHEFGLLRERWSQVKDGAGHVVLLSGEPGIGKSRLVEALKEAVEHEGAKCLELRCSPYHQNSALYPVIEHVQRMLQFQQIDSPDEKLQKLEKALRRRGGVTPPLQSEIISLFAALLSLPHPEGYPALSLSPQRQKEKTHEALVDWLCDHAKQQAVFYAWEDLHWADPSTLELLTLFLAQVPTTRLLTVLTFRPEFTPRWGSHSYLSQLTLGRLGQTHVEVMVEKVAGDQTLPKAIVQQIVSKTDGVPLFVEELTRTLLESIGSIGSVESIGSAIPTTLQDSLMARLDRLGGAKEIAQLGATIGREFDYPLLHAVSPLNEETLQQGLRQLVEAELVFQSGVSPQARYLFKHALVQDTAYQSLLKSRRQQLHQQVAQVLAEQFPETVGTQPELLAYHYTEAGLITQAVPYWQKAGERATQRSAYVEAISHLTRGLELLKPLPNIPEHVQQELTLQVTLGTTLSVTKGYAAPEVERVYTRARELCRQVGETPQLFPVLIGLYTFHLLRAELQTARELAEQQLRLAQSLQDLALLLWSHDTLGLVLFQLGELPSARAHLEQSIALYDPPKHRPGQPQAFGQDPKVTCLSYLSLTLWHLGYPAQARERMREALALAEGLSHPFSLAFALNFDAILNLLFEDIRTVREQTEKLRTLSYEQGFAHWWASVTFRRGWVLVEQGQSGEGISQIRQSLADYQATGAELWRPYQLVLLAEAYGKRGQAEEGLAMLAEALDKVDKTGERCHEVELYRLKGDLTLAQSGVQSLGSSVQNPQSVFRNPRSEAEAYFLKAIDISRKQQAKSLELRATMSLARLWRQQGKTNEAHKMLSEIYNWFTEGFDTKDLQEAKALLDSLESSV
jgi:predicted ATPase/class 3 adenylate cyclase